MASESIMQNSDSTLNSPVSDTRNRPLRDLRISVTDRCNFRCVYCMPREVFGRDYVFLPREALLTFEEIARLARIAVAHGVEKIRLTGGEPLLRKGLEELIAMLGALRTPDGRTLDIALTTNGSTLAQKARALREAGLQHERRGLSCRQSAARHRRGARGGLQPHQDQHGGEARPKRSGHPAHGAPLQRDSIHFALH